MNNKEEKDFKNVKDQVFNYFEDIAIAGIFLTSGILIGITIGKKQGINTAAKWLDSLNGLILYTDKADITNSSFPVTGKEFLAEAQLKYNIINKRS